MSNDMRRLIDLMRNQKPNQPIDQRPMSLMRELAEKAQPPKKAAQSGKKTKG